ncbi:DUF2243 domain-containing protein [Aquabacterium sp. A7-Y]|uniref:DUF2243 domain-containing protein n=1 Tax=Aquabacterium sp. A7-Y TaxID=1349605 RepID=UPI00223D59F5|nr:DUF2243 domain-containing protein [Aquabacterium sp. A7-Y]MCW7538682.1 DUF2243 domain-containing protein [Aquabacterium sp. A7-Y]
MSEVLSPSSFASDPPRGLPWAAGLVGFALGGFFDGILLHQVLQWHHLLSGLEGEGWQDLRVQVLADGLFHALMYLLALAGAVLLLRQHRHIGRTASPRALVGWALLGFGAWHVVDALLSHWWLGLHRVRMDTAHPLAWDLGWLIVFGVLPLALGWRLRAATRRPPSGGAAASAAALVLLAASAGWWAAQPPRGVRSTVTLLLAPEVPAARALQAAERLQGRVLWVNAAGTVWVLAPSAGQALPGRVWWDEGVLALSPSAIVGACLSWQAPQGGLPAVRPVPAAGRPGAAAVHAQQA